MRKLSRWFTLDELTHSETAARYGISNDPTPAAMANLRLLAGVLDRAREYLGHPVFVSSGYRATAVNRAVGGKPTSAHVHGLAADITCPGFGPPIEVAKALANSGIEFDQIIHEFGRWVHISIPKPGTEPRRQRLTINQSGTREGLV